jgi:uncharacterized membrane protein YkoI
MTSPAHRHRPTLIAALLLTLVAACTPAGDPAAGTTSDPVPVGTAGTGTATTGTADPGTAAASTADLVAALTAASDTLEAQIASGDAAAVQDARAELVLAAVRLDRAADWLGADADLTTDDLGVSAAQATATARQRVGDGATVEEIDLDVDDLRLTWQIDLLVGPEDVEVEIDARTGALIEVDD